MTIHFADSTSIDSGGSLGKIVQAVSGTYSTQVSQASNGSGNAQTTLTDTGLSASITPSSSSNKVLVLVTQQYGFDNNSRQNHWSFLLRDASNNVLYNTTSGGEGSLRYKSLNAFYSYWNLNLLHSPSTTSSFTYKVSMNFLVAYGGSDTMYAQRNSRRSDITLLEVGA